MKLFKNQSTNLSIINPEIKRDYIFESSVKSSGAVNVFEDSVIDYRGKDCVYYEIDFSEPIGMDDELDSQLYSNLEFVISNLPFKFMISHIVSERHLLDPAIEFYNERLKDLIQRKASKITISALKNRLYIMSVFNDTNGLIRVIVFEREYESVFLEYVSSVFLVRKIVGDELVRYIESQNNDY